VIFWRTKYDILFAMKLWFIICYLYVRKTGCYRLPFPCHTSQIFISAILVWNSFTKVLQLVYNMSKSHLHGRDGFTIFHSKKLILLQKNIIFWLFNIIGSLVKGFQYIPHVFTGLTMRDGMILNNPNRGDENVPYLQIVLDLLFIIFTPIGFRLL